jgi:NitT/TauT family transport system permease protein
VAELAVSLKELTELEQDRKKITPVQKVISRIVAALPVIAGVLHLIEYLFVPNKGTNSCTFVYAYIVGIGVLVWGVLYIISFFRSELYETLKYKSALYTVLFILLTLYDIATLKTGTLIMPYFPWLDKIINSIIGDREKLLDSAINSLKLLFTGYAGGVLAGLICGIGAGWSKKVRYWVNPFVRILGAIPTTTYMPIIMILATSLFGGSAFLIGLGVWFPVTVSSLTGVSNINTHYYEVAETLGTSKAGILFRVVVPAAMPTVFGGLTQGMSVACITLMAAEMMGVESGLGWYINWQKGWAEFSKMYGAIIIICFIFVMVNSLLNVIKRYVLRWQKGENT